MGATAEASSTVRRRRRPQQPQRPAVAATTAEVTRGKASQSKPHRPQARQKQEPPVAAVATEATHRRPRGTNTFRSPASSTPAASTSWTLETDDSIVAVSVIVQAVTTTIMHATSKGTVVQVVQPYSLRCGINRRTSGVERRVVNEEMPALYRIACYGVP